MKAIRIAILFCLIVLTLGLTYPIQASTATVTATNLQGWVLAPGNSNLPAVNAFVVGPGTPPAGIGSYRVEINDPGSYAVNTVQQKVEMFVPGVAGTLLSNLSTLSYATYLDPAATNTNQWYLNIYVKYPPTSVHWYDERLSYTPAVGTAGIWTNSGNMALGTTIYSSHLYGAGSNTSKTLSAVNAAATIVEITISMGDLQAHNNYDGYKGNLDNVVVNGTTYDFEGVALPAVPTAVAAPTSAYSSATCTLLGHPANAAISAVVPDGITTTGNIPVNVCYDVLTDPAQIGVTDRPITLAVDVIAFTQTNAISVAALSQPIKICLQGSGSLLYRDATGMPRLVTPLAATSQGGFTCGTIPNAGTVILVSGAAAPAGSSSSSVTTHALQMCIVTTNAILNLHSTSSNTSTVLTLVPNATKLSAVARAGDWMQVVYGSSSGWLSVPLLALYGNCA